MAAPQEIEIKFLIPELKALEKKLRELGFREETPSTHEVNTLYDLPGQKLRRKGELLRLRDYGGNWRLTHKSKVQVGRHKSRGELETVKRGRRRLVPADQVQRLCGMTDTHDGGDGDAAPSADIPQQQVRSV